MFPTQHELRSGVARVAKCVSEMQIDPPGFDWDSEWLIDVVELDVGSCVIVLPTIAADAGWAPVVFQEGKEARFGWMHPNVLVNELDVRRVVVGHSDWRGQHAPTHEWLNKSYRTEACIFHCGTWVLDARWRGHGEYGTDGCQGYCRQVADYTARSTSRMADILDIVQKPGTEKHVVCERAVHRSVSAGMILLHLCGYRVDWSHAKHPHNCEHGCATVQTLAETARRLPKSIDPARAVRTRMPKAL